MALFDITVIKNDTNTWFRTELHSVCFISRLYTQALKYLLSVQHTYILKIYLTDMFYP